MNPTPPPTGALKIYYVPRGQLCHEQADVRFQPRVRLVLEEDHQRIVGEMVSFIKERCDHAPWCLSLIGRTCDCGLSELLMRVGGL